MVNTDPIGCSSRIWKDSFGFAGDHGGEKTCEIKKNIFKKNLERNIKIVFKMQFDVFLSVVVEKRGGRVRVYMVRVGGVGRRGVGEKQNHTGL